MFGGVFMVYEIKVELPYPDTSDIEVDRFSASIIYPAFIGAHSELNAIVQYAYHELEFNKQKNDSVAKRLLGISVCETHHFHLLGQTLKNLGAHSIFNNYPQCVKPSSFCHYKKELDKMIIDDISSEMESIQIYSSMLKNLNNEKVKKVIERIVLDEELHLKVLKELLNCQYS